MNIHLLRPSLLVRRCINSPMLYKTPLTGRPLQQCIRQATTTGGKGGSTPPTLYARYQAALKSRPFLVQAVQVGTLMACGDLIAQTCVEKRSADWKDVDFARTARYFALGVVFVGPCIRFWYGLLDKRLRHPNAVVRTLQKVFVDQFVFAPVFLAMLVSVISFMQNQDVAKIEQKLRNEYLDILTSNYFVWPWVQLVNFRFMPLNYQVPLTQVVAVMWNIYVSWKTNKQT